MKLHEMSTSSTSPKSPPLRTTYKNASLLSSCTETAEEERRTIPLALSFRRIITRTSLPTPILGEAIATKSKNIKII